VNGALAGTMALAHLALIVWLVVGGRSHCVGDAWDRFTCWP
jgi:hypothetical protein